MHIVRNEQFQRTDGMKYLKPKHEKNEKCLKIVAQVKYALKKDQQTFDYVLNKISDLIPRHGGATRRDGCKSRCFKVMK